MTNNSTDIVRDQLAAAYLELRAELLRFLTARLGQPGVAEDLHQDLFVRIQTAQLPAAIGDARAFLYRMAYNLANDHMRGHRRRRLRDGGWLDATTHKIASSTAGDPIADVPDADDAIDAKRRLETVAACLAELPPKCMTVFTLHRLRGLSHKETAAQLGISTKTVEKHMANALRHFFRRLGGSGREDPGS